jgi:hypothetical protein
MSASTSVKTSTLTGYSHPAERISHAGHYGRNDIPTPSSQRGGVIRGPIVAEGRIALTITGARSLPSPPSSKPRLGSGLSPPREHSLTSKCMRMCKLCSSSSNQLHALAFSISLDASTCLQKSVPLSKSCTTCAVVLTSPGCGR